MSAIELWKIDPETIPVPEAGARFVFLDAAGVLSYKDDAGLVTPVIGAGPAGAVGAVGPAGPAGADAVLPDNLLVIAQTSADITNSVVDLVAVQSTIPANKLAVGDLIVIDAHGEADPSSTATNISMAVTVAGVRVQSVFGIALGTVTTKTKQGWRIRVNCQVRVGQMAVQMEMVHSQSPADNGALRVGPVTLVPINLATPVTISAAVFMVTATTAKLRVAGGFIRRVG